MGRFFVKSLSIQKPFHGGVIHFDAIEQPWAWQMENWFEDMDRQLQDTLLELSRDYTLFIDIGCNIGTMTLSVLLRNQDINATCIDPNSKVIELLKKSLLINGLNSRADVIEAAIGETDGYLNFYQNRSVTGHMSDLSMRLKSIGFTTFINGCSREEKCLVKIDVEGYEAVLLKRIRDLKFLNNLCLVVELHSKNFNGVGSPNYCLDLLKGSGATVVNLNDEAVTQVEDTEIHQVIARW